MYIKKKVKFEYESKYIDSVYVFDDGDFILFGVADLSLENCTNDESKDKSTLYDGKTLKAKLILKVSSAHCFFNLFNNEFSICKGFSHFQLYKFNSNRTTYESIQQISLEQGGAAKILFQALNGDLCADKNYTGYNIIYIYRKSELNPKYEPYGNKYLYQIEDTDNLININDKEILGYKRRFGNDSIILKIINNEDYKIKRQNEIKFDDISGKRLYFKLPLYKINENKIIATGTYYLYIFGIDNLELETTIKFDKSINKILIRPKGNIFLLTQLKDPINLQGINDSSNYYHEKYINNIKIDFKINDLIENKEEKITKITGNNKDLFELYNYIGNGLVSLIDKAKITIYEDCDD